MKSGERERLSRIDAILEGVLELPEAERRAFLDRACAGDHDLVDEVTQMLEWGRDESTLDPDRWQSRIRELAAIAGDLNVPERIGPYRIAGELGRGGSSTVYRAVRGTDEFHHEVALKVFHDPPTGELLRRFHSERHILARLNHPNIARFHDGGVDQEVAYLAMELVEGQPITEYCAERRLDLAQRLRLFRLVLGAVEYAHQNLVVHADLKPANVVVTPSGQVKLLDFGISRLTGAVAGSRGAHPEEASYVTPECASPEQLSDRSVTPASDVYQLGLLLYRLLTGVRAYEVDLRSIDSVRRSVLEAVITPPSQVTAPAHPVPPRHLRGDLDAIVMKALDRVPALRYASAGRMSDDITAFLNRSPVQARPQTLWYRAAKFLSRNRWAATLAGTVLVFVGAYGYTMLEHSWALEQERDRARDQALVAEEVKDFLVGLFAGVDINAPTDPPLTAREFLDRGAAWAEEQPEVQPAALAEIKRSLGEAYRSLGEFDVARRLITQALEHDVQIYGETHVAVANDLLRLGEVEWSVANYEMARRLFTRSLELFRELEGEDHPMVVALNSYLGTILLFQGDFRESVEWLRGVLDHRRRVVGDEHQRVGTSLSNLAFALRMAGRFEEAEAFDREALALRRRLSERHPDVAISLCALSRSLTVQGKLYEAGLRARECLNLRSEVLPAGHELIDRARHVVAVVQAKTGELDAAESTLRAVLGRMEDRFGAGHRFTVEARMSLAELLAARGERSEAESLLRANLAIMSRDAPEDHPTRGSIMVALLGVLNEGPEFDPEREYLAETAAAIFAKKLDGADPRRIEAEQWVQALPGRP